MGHICVVISQRLLLREGTRHMEGVTLRSDRVELLRSLEIELESPGHLLLWWRIGRRGISCRALRSVSIISWSLYNLRCAELCDVSWRYSTETSSACIRHPLCTFCHKVLSLSVDGRAWVLGSCSVLVKLWRIWLIRIKSPEKGAVLLFIRTAIAIAFFNFYLKFERLRHNAISHVMILWLLLQERIETVFFLARKRALGFFIWLLFYRNVDIEGKRLLFLDDVKELCGFNILIGWILSVLLHHWYSMRCLLYLVAFQESLDILHIL